MNNIRIVEKDKIEGLPVGIKLEEVRVYYKQPNNPHHQSGQRVLGWAIVEQEDERKKIYEIDGITGQKINGEEKFVQITRISYIERINKLS